MVAGFVIGAVSVVGAVALDYFVLAKVPVTPTVTHANGATLAGLAVRW